MANEGRAETRYASMIEGVGEDDHRALRGLGFSRHEPAVPLRHMYLITCLGVLEDRPRHRRRHQICPNLRSSLATRAGRRTVEAPM